jgi:murein DD-endopeptidase MepM/ murein hydrolase activator NlpD
MIEVFFGLDHSDRGDHSAPEILYAAIEQNGLKRKYYRYKTRDDGEVGYYDDTGKSAKKFLMRKPMSTGKFRSRFGMRRHPILRYRKMHSGVDWSAPRGTPIMAAGDGVIREAKWRSGYGKWISIRHANGYETGYAHQTRFARGIRVGQRVRQGQVIGYVGSTGLSTGPHLHYEVLVNNRAVNPMRIRLPRGRVLKADAQTEFEKERDRTEALIERARNSHLIASK